MKETGLMFKAPLVRAILSGQKTQTRRICKPAVAHNLSQVVEVPDPQERGQVYNGSTFGDEEGDIQFSSPFGGLGDRIFVRETFAWVPTACESDEIVFAADYQDGSDKAAGVRYIPSIHMPKAAARIWLEVTGVRVEPLQSISRGDAMAEGCPFPNLADDADPREWFAEVWKSTGGDWAANPWVWVIDFKRIEAKAKKED